MLRHPARMQLSPFLSLPPSLLLSSSLTLTLYLYLPLFFLIYRPFPSQRQGSRVTLPTRERALPPILLSPRDLGSVAMTYCNLRDDVILFGDLL